MSSRLKHTVSALALATAFLVAAPAPPATAAPTAAAYQAVHYRTVDVDGVQVFYREAGKPTAPTILLIHGFPTSSHMFRDLIPILAKDYHVVALDLPGFGLTQTPKDYHFTFADLATTTAGFADKIGLKRFAIYVFDYGAPTGFRLALAHPERVAAIISQNGNAYEEGLSKAWNPIQAYWHDPSAANRDALRAFLKPETTQWQYKEGVADPTLVSPDAWRSDQIGLDSPGNAEIQLDLFGDYASNVALYPAFQAYFRDRQPPLLAVWGKNDPFFIPAGAEAYRRDLPKAEIHFYDTGHFALETHAAEIGGVISHFLAGVKF